MIAKIIKLFLHSNTFRIIPILPKHLVLISMVDYQWQQHISISIVPVKNLINFFHPIQILFVIVPPQYLHLIAVHMLKVATILLLEYNHYYIELLLQQLVQLYINNIMLYFQTIKQHFYYIRVNDR